MRRLVAGLLLVALAVVAILLWRGSPPRRAGSGVPEAEAPVPTAASAPTSGAAPQQAETEPGSAKNTRTDGNSVAAPETADASLIVLVVDENKRPWSAAGVKVTYLVGSESISGPHAETDAEGRVRFAVRAGTRGYVTARVGGYSRSNWLNAARDQETTTTIVVRTGGRVAGVVRHATKGLLKGVRVIGAPEEQGPWEFIEATTDTEGRFLLDPVPRGSWKLSLGSEDFHLKDYISVKLGQGGSADVGVVVVGGGAIEGLIRDAATSQPLAGVTVELRDPVFGETTTDVRGGFRFDDLTPCLYDISFRRNGYGWRSMNDVEVRAEKPTGLTVDLAPGAVLHMHAHDAEGRPYIGMAEFMYSNRNAGGSTQVFFDEKGHARFQGIPPGRYQISIGATGIDGTSMSVEIVPGENTVQFTVGRRRAPAGSTRSLHGAVRDAKTAEPIPGVRVYAQSGEAYTDERGEYVLADLQPGRCRPSAYREGYGDRYLEQITIAKGEERRLDFTLEPAVTVHVILKDKDGNPMPGEALTTFRRLADRVPTVIRLEADAQGRATVRRLLPGPHKVSCFMPGIGGSEREVTISAGEYQIEIVLR